MDPEKLVGKSVLLNYTTRKGTKIKTFNAKVKSAKKFDDDMVIMFNLEGEHPDVKVKYIIIKNYDL